MKGNLRDPLVSVVIPIYNAQDHFFNLLKCIESQTYTNYEFILVDDGSTDKTRDMIKSAARFNSKIKLLLRDRPPKGAPTCRNLGLASAEGKYVIYIDADDIFEKFFLEQRVKYMEMHDECDFAIFRGGTVFEEDGETYFGNKVWGSSISNNSLTDFLSVNYPFSIWNNIYRLESFKNFKWDERLKVYQDFDFAVMSIIDGYKYDYVEDSKLDYYYRKGQTDNLSSDFVSKGKYESTKYLFNKISRKISNFENRELYTKAFSKFYILHFTRVLYDGSEEQIIDYIKFCRKTLTNMQLLKLKITYKVYKLLQLESPNKLFTKKLLIYSLYYPNSFYQYVRVLFSKAIKSK